MATPIPENHASFSAAQIRDATDGELLQDIHELAHGVVTDSRADVRGKLFVALKGPSFDGHAFVSDCVARGATALLVSKEVDCPEGVSVVRVPCTLTALGELARWHRQRWGGRLMAIGGSAGKTTTRAAVQAVLETLSPGHVHGTVGNLNNRVGVPMVLLGLEARHRYAVVELGTNQLGEVNTLMGICLPNVSLLTLVGLEHSEGLGDLDGIEAEEGALLRALPTTGVAIANGDDTRALRQLRSSSALQVCYGTLGHCDYQLVRRDSARLGASSLLISRPGASDLQVECPLLGLPGALACVAAMVGAEKLAEHILSPAQLQKAMESLAQGVAGRLAPKKLANQVLLLDDTYNSNPASVASSLSVARELAENQGGRVIAVLGEMGELGALSIREHSRVGEELSRYLVAFLVAVSGDAVHMVEPAESRGIEACFVSSAAEALSVVVDQLKPGDVVLVKASRSVAAEKIVEGLIRSLGRAA